jgi:electron transport complex protein RnfG
MKKFLGLVLSLTVISAVCAGILAFVNTLTKKQIAEILVAKTVEAAQSVLPPGSVDVTTAKTADGETFYIGRNAAGAVTGYAIRGADAGGYGGVIVLMVGFQADKKTVVCYRTLSASETPGLGTKMNDPSFASQFAGRSAAGLAVTKDGGEIEAITAATITSRAVCRAIAHAAAKLK